MVHKLIPIFYLAFSATLALGQINIVSGTSLVIESGTVVNILSPQQIFVVNNGADVLNNGQIFLDDSASISEASGSPIYGNGTERITRSLTSAMANENPGGLGCEMTSNAIIGNITVVRGHTDLQNDLTDLSAMRWFEVIPDVNGGLDLALRFHYDDTELNGNTESTLEVNRSSNGGLDWQILSSTVNINDNYVDAASIDSLMLFTLFAPGLATNVPAQNDLGQELLLFPVPSAGKVWITPPSGMGNAERLLVMDISGRTVLEQDLGAFGDGPKELVTNSLSSGVYSVVLISEKGSASAKMIIEK